jgi:hypothetical protein
MSLTGHLLIRPVIEVITQGGPAKSLASLKDMRHDVAPVCFRTISLIDPCQWAVVSGIAPQVGLRCILVGSSGVV